jgi:hypothetical protein
MPTRTVLLRRLDASGYTSGPLSIELIDLSYSAALETIQTGLGASGWLSLFQDHLAPSQDLIWTNDGMGAGRELRRSFSNILGRFFARNYLEQEIGARDLVSIEGNHFRVPNTNLQVRRKGKSGDLPDWVGLWNDAPLIAEAKGSHDKRDWINKQWPDPINVALRQVRRVEIVQVTPAGHRVPRAPPQLFRAVAVGSKWATQTNNAPPVMIAVDDLRKHKPRADETFRIGLAEAFAEQTLGGMGFDTEGARERALENQLVTVTINGEVAEPGVVSLLGWFGVFPIKTDQDVRVANELIRLGQPLAAMTFARDALLSVDGDRTSRDYRRQRMVRRGAIVVTMLGPDIEGEIAPA